MKALAALVLLAIAASATAQQGPSPEGLKTTAIERLTVATDWLALARKSLSRLKKHIDDIDPSQYQTMHGGLVSAIEAGERIEIVVGILQGLPCGVEWACHIGAIDVTAQPGRAAMSLLANPRDENGDIILRNDRVVSEMRTCISFVAYAFQRSDALGIDDPVVQDWGHLTRRCGLAWISVDDAMYFLAQLTAFEHAEARPGQACAECH